MAKRLGGGRDWEQRGRVEHITAGARQQAERIQAILSAHRKTDAAERVSRPGVATHTIPRYTTTAAPTDWTTAGRGQPISNAILDSIEDGADRLVLAWPYRPGGGINAAAVSLREARASGRLAHATVGIWPWRGGATWAARSILVHPGDVAQAAARIATELQKGSDWADASLSHLSLCLLEVRLRDLVPIVGSPVEPSPVSGGILVRSPTLLETTSVFPPGIGGKEPPYHPDPSQVLRRVRDHTHMGDRNAGLEDHVMAVGDPSRAPFAVFGIPAAPKVEHLRSYLTFSRFRQVGLDAIVVDVTRTGRSELPEDWEKRFNVLLDALAGAPGRRPPVIVLAEDAFSMRKANRALRAHGTTQRPRRRAPIEVGAYLPEPGLLGPVVPLAQELAPIRVEADIKDASLAGLRRDLVRLGRDLRQAGHAVSADGASKALAFLRRSASLPIGVAEAQHIADILHEADEEVDAAARSLFRPKMALASLAAVQDLAPAFGDVARRLVSEVEAKLALWTDETPVSAKLMRLLAEAGWNAPTTVIAIADRRLVDIYLSSDRALLSQCLIVDHRGLAEQLDRAQPERLIVLGPTPEAIRTLLTTQSSPNRVVLLGDAAGSALLAAEIAPLARIGAFAPVAQRARALADALQRGGADEQLDLAEAEFSIAAALPEGEIDFTQAGEAYRGDVVHLRTARGYRIAYRPTSDVLLFSPAEARPFERTQARVIRRGDRVLVFDAAVREPIRRALAGSREALKQLGVYHDHIEKIYAATPGTSLTDKARHILRKMQEIDPAVGAHEFPNIIRWLTAGHASASPDGAKQPRAARDWPRFKVFMEAVAVAAPLAELYWRTAVVPARSYRAREGYLFNQRVVQFILDPEGTSAGAAAWKAMQGLWQLVLDAVDEVIDIETTRREGRNG